MDTKNANGKTLAKAMKKAQGGFTLIEILISAVIIAIVASIVGPLMTETKDKNVTVGQEVGLMRATIQNIDDRYFDENITATLDNAELIASRILPKAYRRNASNEIFNLWGGQVTIAGVEDDGLVWTSAGVPAGVCSKFVDDSGDLGFETVTVGGTEIVYSAKTNAAITTACEGAIANDVVEIIWTRAES